MAEAIGRDLDIEDELADDVATFEHDPLGFVLWAYDWGEGVLAEHHGPRQWQADAFDEIGQALRAGEMTPEEALPVLLARASGHGIGKSGFVGMVCHWAMATFPDTRVVVTANTDTQLRTKTMPEIGKWTQLSRVGHWFTTTATAVYSSDPKHIRSWRLDAVPWSEHNTEAFAGLHNKGRRIVLVFDEASSIADKVWEVAEGALTDEGTEIMWLAFGNPTRNTGRFRECFGKHANRWRTRQIDSRTVDGTNKRLFKQWAETYGEDSDFFRVRVKGQFPRASSMQFIPSDYVDRAAKAEPRSTQYDPLVMGVDVARFGDDKSVIRFRRGRDARSIPPVKLRNVDTMQLAGRVCALMDEHKPDAVFIDETGIGAGVVDRCRQLHHDAIGIIFGSGPDRPVVADEKVANKRAEMWALAKDWLRTGGAIDDDPELRADLEGVEFGYTNKSNAIVLERKDDMKARGLSSPDDGDALALTFAKPVSQRLDPHIPGRGRGNGQLQNDYDPYA